MCTPFHKNNSYEIRVNHDGILYAFGGGKNPPKDLFDLGTKEINKWENANGVIRGPTVRWCLSRKVIAGEVIKLNDSLVQLAAKSIALNKPR